MKSVTIALSACTAYILLNVYWTTAQQTSTSVSLCTRATNCTVCMQAHPDCRWCITKASAAGTGGWSATEKRCNDETNLLAKGCPAKDIMNIDSQIFKRKQTPTRDASDDGTEGAIQISPQQLSLQLRPNEKYKFNMTFRLAKDYPVDLYYLMDLSQSMGDDKKKVADLGINLATEMRKITKDVRLGFGSFVDKVLMPYVNALPARLITPCSDCESPYSFKHRLSLTDNTVEFGQKVNDTKISGNLDGPEGGFDAMMQAIVCDKAIGWRNQSRKMLIFSTDAPFHSAGDGKLGGVIEPNDGTCHMENNEYTYATIQDYPSISQIASKVAETRINVIFAVTASQAARYDQLSKIIPGSVAGTLAEDSANVVHLVRENYEKISSKVTMTTRRPAGKGDDLKVTIRSLCEGFNASSPVSDTAACDALRPGKAVTFEVEIHALSCANAKNGRWSEEFDIYPIGLSESLRITAEVLCDCGCTDTEPLSPACSGVGKYECGICQCDKETHYGDICQCAKSDAGKDTTDIYSSCVPPANSSLLQQPCTGRGECLCGKCQQCDCLPGSSGPDCRRFEGKYCQCNPDNCPRNFEGVCSGPLKGTCVCDEETAFHFCRCADGYTGSECECATSDDGCRDPSNPEGSLCNGKGTCKCGRCECETLTSSERYTGRYCEECSTCASKCSAYKTCVQCHVAEKLGWLEDSVLTVDQCLEKCNDSLITYQVVDGMPVGDIKDCTYESVDDCTVRYGYRHTPRTGYTVYIKNVKECVTKPNLMVIIPGVVGGVVLLGIIALLIWKLVTTIHDRREFANFEKEKQQAKWESAENPIYVNATSTFKNPTYKGSEKL